MPGFDNLLSRKLFLPPLLLNRPAKFADVFAKSIVESVIIYKWPGKGKIKGLFIVEVLVIHRNIHYFRDKHVVGTEVNNIFNHAFDVDR